MYRVILADDHVLVRQGLKRILAETGDLQVVGEACDGLELLDVLAKSAADLVVLDISMPRLRGIEAIHEIRALYPDVAILILTMHKDMEYLHLALSSGAKGYVLKDDAEKELFDAIARVRQDKTYVSPHFSEELVDDFVHLRKGEGKRNFDIDPLSPRERQIAKLIAEGHSSKEIAEFLFISVRTVDNHRARIMEKLNLKKVTDLVKYAIEKGYL
jgi:DNA-binding NarL/FixJ family response regulator